MMANLVSSQLRNTEMLENLFETIEGLIKGVAVFCL
jgi:hypothetical protein